MATKTTKKEAPKADETEGKAKAKKVAAPKSGDKPNALQKPLQPTPELAAIVGSDPLPRGEVVSKVWDYIRKHELQNPQNKREILADDNLKKVFGKDKATMFEMNKYLAQHLK
ncbi:MAG: SWIB/MDM2 domain-containing protein [Methylobacterium frigidaeris]